MFKNKSISLLLLVTLFIILDQCQQLDGGSTLTGEEANQRILTAAIVGQTGYNSGRLPLGSKLKCSDGSEKIIEFLTASGDVIFDTIFVIPVIGLSETKFYSKADVNECVNAVTTIFFETSKVAAQTAQKNVTCDEKNPFPPSPAITSLLACDIESKYRLRLTFGSGSSSNDEE